MRIIFLLKSKVCLIILLKDHDIIFSSILNSKYLQCIHFINISINKEAYSSPTRAHSHFILGSYAARLKPRTHALFYTFCFLINFINIASMRTSECSCFCNLNPIEIVTRIRTQVPVRLFLDPCGPLLLISLYNIEHK